MRRNALGLLAVWLIASATAAGADFWTTTPYLEWSNKDVEKMMTGSPWATVVAVPLPPSMPVPSGDAGGGRGGGRGGDDSFGAGPRRIRLTISWRSARPVKQALVRSQVGQGGTPTDAQKAFLEQDGELYVVGVLGLPLQYVRPGGDTTVKAFLHRKNKPDIDALQAGSQMATGGPVLLIGFPRGDITADEGEVEFEAKFEGLDVKKKFKLKEMVVEGKLEL